MFIVLQLVTTVPTSKIPKNICRRFRGKHDKEEEVDHDFIHTEEVGGRRGQILWVRGLTRLQQQVGFGYVVFSSVNICHIVTITLKMQSLNTLMSNKNSSRSFEKRMNICQNFNPHSARSVACIHLVYRGWMSCLI